MVLELWKGPHVAHRPNAMMIVSHESQSVNQLIISYLGNYVIIEANSWPR